MSIAPNLCCDETKNRGTYTHVTDGTEVGVLELTRERQVSSGQNPA